MQALTEEDSARRESLPNEDKSVKLINRSFPILHKVFIVGIILKGINALTEFIISVFLFAFPIDKLRGFAVHLASARRLEWFRSHNVINLSRIESWIGPDTKAFFSWFFLSHGAIKAVIIVCLVAGWVWAYPLGIAVFSGFVVYQIVEMTHRTHAVLYFILTVLDIFVIVLTFNEWHHAKGKSGKQISPKQDK